MVRTCSPTSKKALRNPWRDLSGPSGIHFPSKMASLRKAHRLLISTADKLSRCPPSVQPHIPQAQDFESGFFGLAGGRRAVGRSG